MMERFAAICAFFELLKSDCAVHVVAEYGLTGGKVAVDHAFDGLTQKGMTKSPVILSPCAYGFFEVVGKWHWIFCFPGAGLCHFLWGGQDWPGVQRLALPSQYRTCFVLDKAVDIEPDRIND